MKAPRSILIVVAFLLVACSSLHTPLPLTDVPPPPALSSSVFVGHGQAFRFTAGSWVPVPEYDYEFSVLERRFSDRWEAVKEIHRLHPRYDGRAGPRDQTLYFMVRTSPAADGGLDLTVEGTLGAGKGHEKPGGGIALEVTPAEKGWFVPFDTTRIRQSRATKNGRLEEVVELFSRRNGREVPFMKMQEEGIIYRPIGP
jgi:hypothetical protein